MSDLIVNDNDALGGFGANDEVVAHVVIYASSGVACEYTDQLGGPDGLAWLGRRLDQAKAALGNPEARVDQPDADDVVSERT